MGQMKHFGSHDELKAIVRACGVRGKWTKNPERNQFRFDGQGGEILNWWPHRGTVQIQGAHVEALKRRLSGELAYQVDESHSRPARPSKSDPMEDVNEVIRAAKKLIVRQLGLQTSQVKILLNI